MRRNLKFFIVGLLAVFGMALVGGSPASAHNTFVDSSPRDGEVLATAPTTWSVTFSKSVPLESASGSVVNGDGVRSTLANPRHGIDDTVVVFDLPVGLNGAVTARWRLVSTDGHVITGRVAFTVGTGVPTGVATAGESAEDGSGGVPDSVRAGVRFANYAALLLLGGILFIDFDIAAGALASARGRRLALWGVGVLTAAPAAQFLMFVDDVNDGSESFVGAIGDALSLTAGAMLFVRILIGGALAYLTSLVLRAGSLARPLLAPFAATAAMYLVALAYVGHSRSQSAPWLGVPLDVAHTAAMSTWLGGLVVMVAVVVPLVGAESAVVAFRRFGEVAQRAVIVIAATGVIQTIRLHGNPGSLLTSTHGLLLVAKVSFVALMIRLAARNRRVLLDHRSSPMPNHERTRALLLRATTTEVLFGVAVIALTAILVAVTPD